MTGTTICIICAVIAYLIGSVNTSLILSKFKGKDVRSSGSGNAGATNTLRVFGKGAAAIVVLGDALKGVVAVLIAMAIKNAFIGVWYPNPLVEYAPFVSMPPVYLAAFFVILGHNFPVYFGFKGGKGIMTSAAVIFMLDWKIGLIVFALAIAVMALTRYVSLGSCLAAVAFPIAVILLHGKDIYFVILSVAMGALALFMHRANIVRLIKGTESKLNFKK